MAQSGWQEEGEALLPRRVLQADYFTYKIKFMIYLSENT